MIARATPAACPGAILLVEDDDAVRGVVRRILHTAGYSVLEAGNGHEALQAVEGYAGRVDLLLTDAVMPALGGWELIRRLRSVRPDLPVLVMSGYEVDDVRRESGDLGETALLTKPFGSDQLLGSVRHVLEIPLL